MSLKQSHDKLHNACFIAEHPCYLKKRLYFVMVCKTTKFLQCFLFCRLKNTRCYAEIWNKAIFKNDVLKKFCDCWGFAPAG